MANKINADNIRWILDLDVKGVQSKLTGLSSKSIQLTNDNKNLSDELKIVEKDMDNLQKQISKLAASGDTTSEKYLRLKKSFSETADDANDLRYQIDSNKKAIDEYNKKANQLVQTLKVEDMTMNQLKTRAKDLQQQLNKTSQAADSATYNHLDNELKEIQSRMRELKTGGEQTEKTFSLFSSGATKALGLFVAALATAKAGFETFKDLMLSNKATGVEFQATMDGIGNAVDSAKTAIANMDFTNFIEGMHEAYRIGKEVSIMLDELFERENSFKLTSTPIKAELEELKTQFRDVNLPYEERLKIGEQIIEKTKELAALEKDIKQQAVDANIKLLESQTNLTDAEREYVVTNYNANRNQILFAKEIIALENKKAQFKDGFTAMEIQMNAQITKELNEQIKALKNSADYSEMAYNSIKKYMVGNNDLIGGFVNSFDALLQVDNNTNKELRQTETMMNQIKKTMTTGSNSAGKKAIQKEKKEQDKELESLETKHQERIFDIKEKYKSGEIKTEADLNRKIFAEEQAYYLLRENTLEKFIDNTTNKELKSSWEKQLVQIRNKQIGEELKFQKEIEKILLDANPIEKEKRAYQERLDAVGLYGIQQENMTADQLAALEILEKQHQENLDKIRKAGKAKAKADAETAFLDGDGTQDNPGFKKRKEEMQTELNELMATAAANPKSFDAEMAVHVKRLEMINEEIEARNKAGLETTKQIEQQGKIEANMTASVRKELQKRAAQFQQYGNTVGQVLGNVMTGQENALKAFGDASVDIVFDILSKIIEAELIKVMASSTSAIMRATAEAMATPLSAVSFGAAGFATAAILTGAITAATVAAKSALKGMLGKKKGSSTSSSGSDSGKSSGTITVKERAEGKYDVMGADDGRMYRNVPYTGDAKTGVVSRPTLMGERGSELVISHPDFMALQKHINYPVIMQAIQDARFGRVPQRAEGKYDSLNESINISSGFDPVLLQQLTVAINNLNKKEFKGNWGVTEYQAILASMSKEDNRFTK